MNVRKKILFFGEPATLAHVARPVVLARGLDARRYEIELATGPDFRRLAEQAGLRVRALDSIGTRAYLAAVAAGRVVFSYRTLERYVRDDLRQIEDFSPDVVVGDFRLSLAVSARLARVPYVALSNAYWSPYARTRIEVPVHAATRLLGPQAAGALFRPLAPLVLAAHSLPMHRLRRRHGLPSLGFDLGRVFTEGDVTLFADVPQMVPTPGSALPDRYRYIGPVVWSPPGRLPAALADDADLRKPLVYVALGSSGDARLLGTLVAALRTLGCRIVMATGGAPPPAGLPADAITADFLPGDQVAAHARLVVCNGGSPGTHQALQQGTPVLGIPSNLDQLLNMQFVVRCGAGQTLRADQVNARSVRDSVQRLLAEPAYGERAQQVRAWFAGWDPAASLDAILQQMSDAPAGVR